MITKEISLRNQLLNTLKSIKDPVFYEMNSFGECIIIDASGVSEQVGSDSALTGGPLSVSKEDYNQIKKLLKTKNNNIHNYPKS